jgi:hypothetical protein
MVGATVLLCYSRILAVRGKLNPPIRNYSATFSTVLNVSQTHCAKITRIRIFWFGIWAARDVARERGVTAWECQGVWERRTAPVGNILVGPWRYAQAENFLI